MEAEIKLHQRLKNLDLVWKDDNQLEKMKRRPYKIGKIPKSTYYDKYGPNGTLTKAAAGTEKITIFFKISNTQVTNPQLSKTDTLEVFSSNSESEVVNPYTYKITEKIKDLKEQLEKQHNQLTVVEYNYKRAIFEYLTLLNNNNGHGKIDISLEVARKIFIDSESRIGKHQKIIRIIDDEDVAERCHTWIRKQDFNTTPTSFKKFIENELFPNIGITKEKSIALITATRWLNVLGYSFQQYRRRIYYDGHERDDVLQYRKEFLEKMFEHEKYMFKYEGESMDRIHSNLPEGEKERILVVHDECIFYSNDGKRRLWTKDGEMPLRKKGNGRSIMVSEFLTEVDGHLHLQQTDIEKHPHVPEAVRCYLKPGVNQEGYWTAEHLLEQIEYKAIPIFEALYPDCVAVFAFDNSSNHAAFSKDALVVNRMNLNLGGKQPIIGKPKGIKQVLMERGKWPPGGLVLECNKCKEKCQDCSRTSCCARRVIFLEPDFLAQKGAIEELIENAGHKCIFFPKFHCKLNFFERYWDAAKRYSRENCNYSWEGLQRVVPESLDSITLITIRKFSIKCWHYMDLYMKGIDRKLVEYAVKKYKSHRRIPEGVLEELNKLK
ncbi:hypothetical protein RclHR1_18070004 [Rhizophagus clarus]|uniref:Tc1-like transposase DDE domain-containing protein n=1 Tax=Rhizophagus clarus TaxID=94130 RepID=A0A2Z6QYX9_9GLOM|nr:hypothetical protein RclHR1_18070004 [Rhizophagus clarus]